MRYTNNLSGTKDRARQRGDSPDEDDIRQLTDEQLWQMRTEGRKSLIGKMRKCYACQLAAEGASSSDTSGIFDDKVLTLGFARRFATYKRPNLLPARSRPPDSPAFRSAAASAIDSCRQSASADLPGQALIEQWNEFLKRTEVGGRVVFLSDDDMLLTQELVTGVDLWINTPRRPWEACGTSGMKVLVNGGLNFSELDGCWAEAYSPEVGWAIGDGKEHGEDPAWDAAEAEAMYTLLEREVVPEFYDRDGKDMPAKWLGRVRESMARLTPEFSASRAIREYTEDHYLPAASAYRERAAGNSKLGEDLLRWQQDIARRWNAVHFGKVDIGTRDGLHSFRVEVFSGDLNLEELRVELYANPVEGGTSVPVSMTACKACAEPAGAQIYSAEVPATRPASDYTPRVVPIIPTLQYRSKPSRSCGNTDELDLAKETGTLKTSNPMVPNTAESFDNASPPWLETQAKVTACHYVFARMNTLTLGIATDSNRFRISYTYYAHATTFSDEFTSPVAMEQGKTFPVFYNPLNPQENRQSVPGAVSTSRTPLFALGIAGSIVISLLYLAMMRGCN